jgi:hypothetical protein
MTPKHEPPEPTPQSSNDVHAKQVDHNDESQTQPKVESGIKVVVKSPNNNSNDIWNILGFITAGVPLLAAAFFYLVGWTYISNWYGFFRISIYQIDVPTHHILVNSVSLILISIMAFLFAVTIDHIILVIETPRKNRKNKKQNNGSTNKRDKKIQSFNLRRVMVIYILPIIILLGYYLYNCYRHISSFGFWDYPEELLWFITVILSTIIFYIKNLEQTNNSKYASMINGSVIAISILISSVSLAAVDGIADAAEGRQGAWRIPQVHITSKDTVPVLDAFKENCDSNGAYKYGTFGLVAENDQTIFLVPWLNKNESYFSPSSELFILQRSEQTTLYIHVP